MNKGNQGKTTSLLPLLALIAIINPFLSAETITVSNKLEMFICNDGIESVTGDLKKTVIKPTPKEVVFETDAPTEGRSSAYWSIFKDGDKYRMYFRGSNSWEKGDPNYQDATHDDYTCTANSNDGIHWTRPNIGDISYNGSTNNNIVKEGIAADSFTVFRDTNPNVSADKRYKALGRKWAGTYGDLHVFKSADGNTWSPLAQTSLSIASSEKRGQFDSQNLAFWDNTIDQYRIYWRKYINGTRTIITGTSNDCFNWVNDTPLSFTVGGPGEDVLEPGTVNGVQVATPGIQVNYGQTSGRVNNVDADANIHLYTSAIQPYFRNPNTYIGFPTRLITENGHLPSGTNDFPTEVLLMASRNGNNFHFFRNKPVVASTDPTDRGGNRSNYMGLGMVELASEPGKISVYANENYMGDAGGGRLRRFTYRTDGFVAMRAGSTGGTLTSKNLNYSGNTLLLNYVTKSNGYIKIEALNTAGQVIGETNNLTGDVIDSPATWLLDPHLNSGTVKLRFTIKNADLYAYRFSADAGSSTQPPAQADDYTLTYQSSGNGYIIGVQKWLKKKALT